MIPNFTPNLPQKSSLKATYLKVTLGTGYDVRQVYQRATTPVTIPGNEIVISLTVTTSPEQNHVILYYHKYLSIITVTASTKQNHVILLS